MQPNMIPIFIPTVLVGGSGSAVPWYLADGGSLSDVDAIYQFIGAGTLANAYLRIAGNGRNANLDPAVVGGTAPTFDTRFGLLFNGSNQYLKTGGITQGSQTALIWYENLIGEAIRAQFGGRAGGNDGMFILDYYTTKLNYVNKNTVVGVAPPLQDGVVAISGANGFRDGVLETSALTPNTNSTQEDYLGALNEGGSAAYHSNCRIRAAAFYTATKTEPQILAITNALKDVIAPYVKFGVRGLYGQSVTLGNVLQYEYTQAWSVGVTFNRDNVPLKFSDLFFTNVPSAGPAFPGYEFFIDIAGTLRVRIINNFTSNIYIGVYGTTNVCDGKTHRAWATYDGSGNASGVKIYLDGVPETLHVEKDTLGGNTIVGAGQSFYIASQQGSAALFLHGHMKDFVLDNTERDATYVAANSNITIAPTTDANRQLLLLLGEGTGTTVSDTSGNGYDGTVSSISMWL